MTNLGKEAVAKSLAVLVLLFVLGGLCGYFMPFWPSLVAIVITVSISHLAFGAGGKAALSMVEEAITKEKFALINQEVHNRFGKKNNDR